MPERKLIRFIHKLFGVQSDQVLNLAQDHNDPDSELVDVAELVWQMHKVLQEAIQEGGGVDYQQLAASHSYRQFRGQSRALAHLDWDSLGTENEKKAFWINLYNTLILDGILTYQVDSSVQEFPGFFMQAAYEVAGQRFSADDIEHGVLRANRGHPAVPGPQFGRADPRREMALSKLDPRLHFALNCGAEACPPIGVYRAEHLDQQLDLAARSFILSGGVCIDRKQGVVVLSQIFRWYAHDFGGAFYGLGDMQPVLDFIARYSRDDLDVQYLQRGKPRVKYQQYNWKLNAKLKTSAV